MILFKSFCTKPQVAAKNAVVAPTNVITNNAVELYSNNGDDLTNKYNPAVTSVAAWIKADTGVGPSILPGNQECKGIWLDLAIAPVNNNNPIIVIAVSFIKGTVAKITE